jgi:hypothetical protein
MNRLNRYACTRTDKSVPSSTKQGLLALAALCLPFSLGAITFDDWMATFDPSVVPVDQRGMADDPDGDGVPNLVEYLIAGMDPATPDAHLLPEPTISGGNLVYSVPLRAGITEPNIEAAIEVLNTASGEWEVNTENVTEAGGMLTLSIPVSAGSTLARLKVDIGGPVATNNPIALAYPVEYASGEYAWTDQLAWDTVFNVLDFGAVADGDPAYVHTEDRIFDNTVDPDRPIYVIPAGFPHSWGTDNHAAFTAAIAAAHDAGGGVVFIPAGTYYIADHLYLRDGVVLMGETPAPGEDNALLASFNPPSKLLFPRYAHEVNAFLNPNGNPVRGNGPHAGFKRIFTENPLTASNLGLVWLDINRAAIIIDTPSRSPIDTGGNWTGKPAGIRAALQGTNRVVFGIRSNNTAIAEGSDGANFGVPYVGDGQLLWQRWTYRFNANIRIGGGGYALVANCRLNDKSAQNTHRWGRPGEVGPQVFVDDSFEQIGYRTRGTSGSAMFDLNTLGQATFRHANQYGISVNGLFYFSEAGNAADGAVPDPDGNPNRHFGTPTSAPHLFHPGNVIRDSYIFSTLGGKAEISGQGMQFLDNIFDDVADKWAFLMSTGRNQPSGSSFMSRGMLFGGNDAVVSGNHVRTYKHRIGNVQTGGDGGYYVNDGEGIMIDNTTTRVNGLTITNNNTNASIFAYRTRDSRNILIADNVFDGVTGSSNTGGIFILANDANANDWGIKNTLIENNVLRGDHNIRLAGAEIMNRRLLDPGDPTSFIDPTPSQNIIIRNNEHLNNRSIIYNPSLEDAIENSDDLEVDNPGFNVNRNGNNS